MFFRLPPMILALALMSCASQEAPPPPCDCQAQETQAKEQEAAAARAAALKRQEKPIVDIEKTFHRASDRALFYAGLPDAKPEVIAEMRELYIDARHQVSVLKRRKLGKDYAPARDAVSAFADYVDANVPIKAN